MKLRADVRLTHMVPAWLAFLGIMLSMTFVPVAGALTGSVIGAFAGFLPAVVASFALVRILRKRPRDVAASNEELVVDGERIARARFRQGYFTPAGANLPAHVTVQAKGAIAHIDVESEAQANELLDALGLGVDRHATRFYGVAPIASRSGLAGLAATVLACGLFAAAAVTAMPALFLAGVVLAIAGSAIFVPAKIHVGADGVLVKGRVHSDFYDYDAIVGAKPTRRGIELVLRDRVVAIPMTSNFGLTATELPLRDGLVRRIETGAKLHAVRGDVSDPRADVGPWLDRGARTFAEWLRALGREEGGDFRTAPVRTDDLVRLVEDPSAASATRRVAAAVALAKRGSDEDRGRIRVAAEAVAAPKLRLALETIASDAGDERIEIAILEAEEEAREANETRG